MFPSIKRSIAVSCDKSSDISSLHSVLNRMGAALIQDKQLPYKYVLFEKMLSGLVLECYLQEELHLIETAGKTPTSHSANPLHSITNEEIDDNKINQKNSHNHETNCNSTENSFEESKTEKESDTQTTTTSSQSTTMASPFLTLPIISWTQFVDLAMFCKLVDMETCTHKELQNECLKLVSYFNSLGIIFAHKINIGDIYLDPQWLIDVIYSLLSRVGKDPEKGTIVDGVLSHEHFSIIWSETRNDINYVSDDLIASTDTVERSDSFLDEERKLLKATKSEHVKQIFDKQKEPTNTSPNQLESTSTLGNIHSLWMPKEASWRIIQILEKFELGWTDRDMIEEHQQFVRKTNTMIPILLPPAHSLPLYWRRFLDYFNSQIGINSNLESVPTRKLSGFKTIRRSLHAKRNIRPQQIKNKEKHSTFREFWKTKAEVGRPIFERWWFFKFMPDGFFQRLIVRILKKCEISREKNFEQIIKNSRGENLSGIYIVPECYWNTGILLSNEFEGQKVFGLVQLCTCPDKVNQKIRTRTRDLVFGNTLPKRQKKNRNLTSISSINSQLPEGDVSMCQGMLIRLSIWEKSTKPYMISLSTELFISKLLKIVSEFCDSCINTSNVLSLRREIDKFVQQKENQDKQYLEDFNFDIQQATNQYFMAKMSEYWALGIWIEIPCFHCLSKFEFSMLSVVTDKKARSKKTAEEKELKLPHLFSYDEVKALFKDGCNFCYCGDGDDHVRLDHLAPELVSKAVSGLVLDSEEWKLIENNKESDTNPLIFEEFLYPFETNAVAKQIISDFERTAWLTSTEVHPFFMQIRGLNYSIKDEECTEDTKNKGKQIMIKMVGEVPVNNFSLWYYLHNGKIYDSPKLPPSITRTTSCREFKRKLSWILRVHLALQICKLGQFLHSMKPPVILQDDFTTKNIMVEFSDDRCLIYPTLMYFRKSEMNKMILNPQRCWEIENCKKRGYF